MKIALERLPLLKDINNKNSAAGFMTALLAVVSIPAILLEAGANGGLSSVQVIQWTFTIFVLAGLFSIIIPITYKMPVVGANTITGLAFITTVASNYSYRELVGAFVISGALILLVGVTGVFSKLITFVPKEIISAMLAGMIIKYLVSFFLSFQELPLIGFLSIVVFFVCSKWVKRIPPLLASIGVACVVFLITEQLPVGNGGNQSFILPDLQAPEISLLSVVTVSIPLAMLILSNDAAVGLGALQKNNFRPPVNRILSVSGIFTIVAGMFGGNSTNVAGMMSAICSDEEAGPRDKRYMGVVIIGFILLLFGLFSWKLVPFIQALPESFVAILVGFSLLGVFSNSLYTSFSNEKHKLSAAFTFMIAMSNVTLLHVSAPVWALAIGTFIVKFIENPKNG